MDITPHGPGTAVKSHKELEASEEGSTQSSGCGPWKGSVPGQWHRGGPECLWVEGRAWAQAEGIIRKPEGLAGVILRRALALILWKSVDRGAWWATVHGGCKE